jgi:hypothetical protein
LISDLSLLGIGEESIAVVLNNRIRSDTQLPYSSVQEKLGGSIAVTITPAPELLTQATHMQTAAVLCQPESVTAQQIFKLVDRILKNEAGGK